MLLVAAIVFGSATRQVPHVARPDDGALVVLEGCPKITDVEHARGSIESTTVLGLVGATMRYLGQFSTEELRTLVIQVVDKRGTALSAVANMHIVSERRFPPYRKARSKSEARALQDSQRLREDLDRVLILIRYVFDCPPLEHGPECFDMYTYLSAVGGRVDRQYPFRFEGGGKVVVQKRHRLGFVQFGDPDVLGEFDYYAAHYSRRKIP